MCLLCYYTKKGQNYFIMNFQNTFFFKKRIKLRGKRPWSYKPRELISTDPVSVQTQKHKAKVGVKRRTEILRTNQDKVTALASKLQVYFELYCSCPSWWHIWGTLLGHNMTICPQSVNSGCLCLPFCKTEHSLGHWQMYTCSHCFPLAHSNLDCKPLFSETESFAGESSFCTRIFCCSQWNPF